MDNIRFSDYMELVRFVKGHENDDCWDYANCFSQYFVNNDFFMLSFYLRQLCRHRSQIKMVDLWKDLKEKAKKSKNFDNWKHFFVWLKKNYKKETYTTDKIITVEFTKCACSKNLPRPENRVVPRIMFYDKEKKKIDRDGFGNFEMCNSCVFKRVSNKEFWLKKEQFMTK